MPVVTRKRLDARARRPMQWEAFAAAMRDRGFTSIAAMADHLGTDPGTLFRIRRGGLRPGLDLALVMADAAGMTVEQMFPHKPKRKAAA